MPYGRRGSYGRRRNSLTVVSSIKNVRDFSGGVTGTKLVNTAIKAVAAPSSTVDTDVQNGCKIFRIWVVVDFCGIGGTGVLNNIGVYLMKNPGDNLTPPDPFSVGTSNEKKFVIKQWFSMAMRNQDGNNPYHWEGWVRIPRVYQRMGTDDTWDFVVECTAALTGHWSYQIIYKWFR